MIISIHLYYLYERGFFCMGAIPKKITEQTTPPIVREYEIGGVKYIVTATEKPGAKEDAATKVRRLIRNEITGKPGK
jgi:hypothetical protein